MNIFGQKQEYHWERVDLPVKMDVNNIYFFKGNTGLITGNYILELNNDEVKAFSPEPPIIAIDLCFALSKNMIWAAKNKPSNESNFVYYDGIKWTAISSPLSNQITSIFFKNPNLGWLGGDRELAMYDNRSWKLIEFPDINGSCVQVLGNSKDLFYMLTSDGKLYEYRNLRYKLLAENATIIKLINDKIYFVKNNIIYAIIDNSIKSLFDAENKQPLLDFDVLSENNLWVLTSSNILLHIEKDKVEKIFLTSSKNIFKFYIDDMKNIWLSNMNSTILRSTIKDVGKVDVNKNFGFAKIKPIAISTEIKGEYGIAIEDLNNDGLKDIFAVRLTPPNKLYINNMHKSSELVYNEESAERDITAIENDKKTRSNLFYIGTGVADIDNDGYQEIYITSLIGRNKLFLNDGNGYFKDVSLEKGRGTEQQNRSNSVIFADVTNSGCLDMFVANENGTNILYKNNGAGYFTDVTKEAGLLTGGGGMSAAFSDFDNDGKPDLIVVSWNNYVKIYKNISTKNAPKFIDVTDKCGVHEEKMFKCNSVICADVNNDGLMDFYITKRKAKNKLYLNKGNFKFEDATDQYFEADTLLSYGAVFADFDNDGYLDLFLSNVGDSKFYKNIDGKKFVDKTETYGANTSGYGTGLACGDLDNDGDVDVYYANYINGESTVFLNASNNSNFIEINLEGTKSCRDAVGAKILFYKAGHLGDSNFLLGSREVQSGTGYCSHSSREIHFGTTEKEVDIRIYFPASGIIKEIRNQKTGVRLFISEEEGLSGFLSRTKKYIIRQIYTPYIQLISIVAFVYSLILLFVLRFAKNKYKLHKRIIFYIATLASSEFIIIAYLYNGAPLYQAVLYPFVISLLTIHALYIIYDRIILKNINKKEKEQLRIKIARDLHDDLAATLSSAQIYSELLLKEENEQKVRTLSKKISNLLKDSYDSISEIIWNISPLHDSANHLLSKFKLLATEHCKLQNKQLKFEIDIADGNVIINDDLRRNLFLIFKEIMNNIFKHSGTDSIKIVVSLKNRHFKLSIKDYGQGISKISCNLNSIEELNSFIKENGLQIGHGLQNIFSRAAEIDAEINLKSEIGEGTEYRLALKIT